MKISYLAVSLLGTSSHSSCCTPFVFSASVQQRQIFQFQFQAFLLLLHTHHLRRFIEGMQSEGFEEGEKRSDGVVEA
jgi:hypothetical protein